MTLMFAQVFPTSPLCWSSRFVSGNDTSRFWLLQFQEVRLPLPGETLLSLLLRKCSCQIYWALLLWACLELDFWPNRKERKRNLLCFKKSFSYSKLSHANWFLFPFVYQQETHWYFYFAVVILKTKHIVFKFSFLSFDSSEMII